MNKTQNKNSNPELKTNLYTALYTETSYIAYTDTVIFKRVLGMSPRQGSRACKPYLH